MRFSGYGSVRLRGILITFAVALALFVLAACGQNASQPAAATPAQEESAAEAPAEAPAEAAEEPAAEEPAEAPAEEAAPAEAAEGESAAETTTEPALQTFTIVPEGTQARFYIDEVLFGEDKRVEGVSPDVTGEIRLDPANPGASELGVIAINAREFTTDADRRNGAIQRFVLQSEQDEYQYITFTPTAIEGMPEAVTIGEPFSFQVTGELTIRDVTQTETFEVEVTASSESELSGSASTTVSRPNYELTIPEVPMVASVEDEVLLELDFTAVAQ